MTQTFFTSETDAPGALAQVSRMLYLGGIKPPASRWRDDLVVLFRRLLT